MSLTDQNLVLLEPQYRGDFDGAGGLQTSRVLGTGQVPFDQLFPDTADMDYLGRVDIEKLFLAIDAANLDPLLGAYAVIAQRPSDDNVNGLIFPGDDSDTRAEVRSRIEAFRLIGPAMRMFLLETQWQGQTLITCYLAEGEAAPVVGTVICIAGSSAQQFVRIQRIVSSQEVKFNEIPPGQTNPQEFTRTVLMLELSEPLQYDFAAGKASPYTSTRNDSVIHSTIPNDSSRFYGVERLRSDVARLAAELTMVSTEAGLLPASTQDTPVLDYAPLSGRQVWYSLQENIVSRTITGQANGVVTLYFPLPLMPGKTTVTLGSLIFQDNGTGELPPVNGSADGYTVTALYTDRQITISRTSSFSVTCEVSTAFAAPVEAPIYTLAIEITDLNRRLTYDFRCDPLPAETSVWVEYFTRGDWITLKDTGAGTLAGGANEGGGTLVYLTGSGAVSLGALPDIGSYVIVSWCAREQFQVITSYAPPLDLLRLPQYSLPDSAAAWTPPGGGEPSPLHTPTANAGQDVSFALGMTTPLDGSGSSDPDGRQLQYRWRVVSRPWNSHSEPVNRSVAQTTFTPDVAGNYVVGLQVSNGWRVSTLDTKTINVTPATTPVAYPGPAQIVPVGATVYLDGRGSDNAVTYSWSFDSKPNGSTASFTGTSIGQFTADKAGDYVVQLIVNNGSVDSDPRLVTIRTSPRPPIADAGTSQTVTVNTEVTLDGSASSHPDSESVTWTWQFIGLPIGVLAPNFDDLHALQPKFTPTAIGVYVAELRGVTAGNQVAAAAVVIRVRSGSPPSPAPTANAGADVSNRSPGASVTLSGTGTNYQRGRWLLIEQPVYSSVDVQVFLTADNYVNPPSLSTTFQVPAPGRYRCLLITSKLSNGSILDEAFDDFFVTTGLTPIADSGAAPLVAAGAAVTLDGSLSRSLTGEALRYAWTLTTKPNGSTATIRYANTVAASLLTDLVGTYLATLAVTDSHGSHSAQRTVVVTAAPSLPADVPGDLPPAFLAPPPSLPIWPPLERSVTAISRILLTGYAIPGTVTITGANIFCNDDWHGGIRGSAPGSIDYAGQEIRLYWEIPPPMGTTLTIRYQEVSQVYRLAVEQSSFPARDTVTHRASFEFPGAVLPGTIRLTATNLVITAHTFYAQMSGGLNQSYSYYEVTAKSLESQDDSAGRLIASAPNFGRARYIDGIVEIDTRAIDDPARYFGSVFDIREYQAAAVGEPAITLTALPNEAATPVVDTVVINALMLDLSVTDTALAIQGGLSFTMSGHHYYERNQVVYRDRDISAGTERAAGSVDGANHRIMITDW